MFGSSQTVAQRKDDPFRSPFYNLGTHTVTEFKSKEAIMQEVRKKTKDDLVTQVNSMSPSTDADASKQSLTTFPLKSQTPPSKASGIDAKRYGFLMNQIAATIRKQIPESTSDFTSQFHSMRNCVTKIISRACTVEDIFSDLNLLANVEDTIKLEVINKDTNLDEGQIEFVLQSYGSKGMSAALAGYRAAVKDQEEHSQRYVALAKAAVEKGSKQTTPDEMSEILSAMRQVNASRRQKESHFADALAHFFFRNARVVGNVVYLPQAKTKETYYLLAGALSLDFAPIDDASRWFSEKSERYIAGVKFCASENQSFGLRNYSSPGTSLCWVTVTCTGCLNPESYFKRFFLQPDDQILRFRSTPWTKGTKQEFEALVHLCSLQLPSRTLGWSQFSKNAASALKADPLNDPQIHNLHKKLEEELKLNSCSALEEIQQLHEEQVEELDEFSTYVAPLLAGKKAPLDLFNMQCTNFVTYRNGRLSDLR